MASCIFMFCFFIPADRGLRRRQGDSRRKAKFSLPSYTPSWEGTLAASYSKQTWIGFAQICCGLAFGKQIRFWNTFYQISPFWKPPIPSVSGILWMDSKPFLLCKTPPLNASTNSTTGIQICSISHGNHNIQTINVHWSFKRCPWELWYYRRNFNLSFYGNIN
jgi:hypothetical protein